MYKFNNPRAEKSSLKSRPILNYINSVQIRTQKSFLALFYRRCLYLINKIKMSTYFYNIQIVRITYININ